MTFFETLKGLPWGIILVIVILIYATPTILAILNAIKRAIETLALAGERAGNVPWDLYMTATNYCNSQADCSKLGCDECKMTAGCSCGKDQECTIRGNRKANDPPNLALCPMFWFGGIGLILIPLIKWGYDKYSERKGFDAQTEQIAKELKTTPAEIIRKTVEDAMKNVEKETEGKEISTKAKDLLLAEGIARENARLAKQSFEGKQSELENAKNKYEKSIENIKEAQGKLNEESRREIAEIEGERERRGEKRGFNEIEMRKIEVRK